MGRVIYHVVLRREHQSAAVMRRVASAAGLVVNERRAMFFNYAVISGQGSPEAQAVLEAMPEVESVHLDGERAISASRRS